VEFAEFYSGQCAGVYFTLNPVAPPNPDPLSGQRPVTVDDVLRRRLLLIDADPKRIGKVSSTDAEKARALAVIERVRDDLTTRGWAAPIMADSGNGYHLLYRIDLPADDGGLIRRVLHGLANKFDTPAVQIDRLVFDPPRICKLPGTMTCKGENTPERPHRRACVVSMPTAFDVVSRDQLEGVAAPEAALSTSTPAPQAKKTSGPPIIKDQATLTYPPDDLIDYVVKNAANYVAKIPPAIQGQNGDLATYVVICHLAHGFALPIEAAWPILMEYNERCQPPWDEEELLRKWRYAQTRALGPRGNLIQPEEYQRQLRPRTPG
jgi:hypothetical protein